MTRLKLAAALLAVLTQGLNMAELRIEVVIPTSAEVNTETAEHIAEVLAGLAGVVVGDLVPAPNTVTGTTSGVVITQPE